MPDRRLVVFEADPGAPEYGQMRAIAPNKAGGIPIPTFGMGPTTPAVGNSVGEAFYNSTTKTGLVWDGAAWRSIVKDPMLSFATDADLLANTTAGVGTYAISKSTGNVYIKKTGGWSLLGIEEFATVTDLLASTPIRGTIAVALDEGSTWEMTPRGWRCFNIRHFANTAGVLAWTGTAGGAQPGDFAVAEDVDVLYARTTAGWKPRSVWVDTEANIRAATWAMDGQEAFASDTGRAFDRVAGAWVEEPIAHFATEAALLASTLKDGSLAWADDTAVVFIRTAGAWKRLQGPQIGVGATAPTTPAKGDQWFDTTKSQLFIWDGAKWQTSGTEDLHFKEGEVTLGATAVAGASIKLIKNIPWDNRGLYISIADNTSGGAGANFQLFAIPFNGDSGQSVLKEIGSCVHDGKVESFSFHWDSGDNYHLNVKFKADAAGRVYKIGLMSMTGDISGVLFDGTTAGTQNGPIVRPGDTNDKYHFHGKVTLGAAATAGAVIKLVKQIPADNGGIFISVVDETGGNDGGSCEMHLIATNGGTCSAREIHSNTSGSKVEKFCFDWNATDSFYLNVKLKAACNGRVWRIGIMSQNTDLSGIVLDGTTTGTDSTVQVIPGTYHYEETLFTNKVKDIITAQAPIIFPSVSQPHANTPDAGGSIINHFSWRELKHGMKETWFGYSSNNWNQTLYFPGTDGQKKHFWNTIKLVTGTGVFEKSYDDERTAGSSKFDYYFHWGDDNNKIKAEREVVTEVRYFENTIKNSAFLFIHSWYRRASDDSDSQLWCRMEFSQAANKLSEYALFSYAGTQLKQWGVT